MARRRKKRIEKMFIYEEEYTAEEYTRISNSDACARIIVDLAYAAKKAMTMHYKVILKMKIEDMLLKTLGMVDFLDIEGRCEEMLEVICEYLDVDVRVADKYAKDYYCAGIQELVQSLVEERFDSIEPMLNELIAHDAEVHKNFGRHGVRVYDTFGHQV